MKIPFILMILPWVMSLLPITGQSRDKAQPEDDLDSMSISELENRLEEIDTQLENLASFSLRGGIGSIGYRSNWENTTQWVEIQLGQTYPIDEIVLVPCLWRHPTRGFQPDAFPRKLRVVAGRGLDTTGSVITEFSQNEGIPKGIEPLVLPIPGIVASWIRIEATELTIRFFDEHKVLQLAEILIFSAQENVALHQPVKYSSSDRRGMTGAWNERFLVDGFVPYLMDSTKGSPSTAFIANVDNEASLTLDLGATYEISRFHLHAVEQSDTVPQAYSGNLGIPEYMRIEGSNSPDFTDPVELLEYRMGSINETGPTIILEFPETNCRYVRFTPLNPANADEQLRTGTRIGFAEIEVFSSGKNVALGKSVTAKGLRYGNRKLEALTDGNNLYGRILPQREWMNELATRGALEMQRPLVINELNHRYERQKKVLARMTQLVLLLVVVIAFTILIDRYIRMRNVNQVRERIAADLHDELGANIHTIGLISDMAKKSIDSRDDLIDLLDQIREFTERSGDSAKYCTNILEAKGVCEDLVREMETFSARTLADLHHNLSFEGKEFLHQLDSHKRIDLFLFYKECITNILRHSGASEVVSQVTADNGSVCMTVTDNGKGLKDITDGGKPRSLKRRAKLLGARLTAEHPDTGGTRITLKLKTRKFGFL